MTHTHDGLIINLDVGHLQLGAGHRFGINDVAVVLAGEVDPTGRQLADGVVEAAMAETQLIGIGTVSQSKDLMAHANTEDRVPLLQFSHHILYPRDGFRVPGAVRKHDAVGRQGPHPIG